MTDPTEKVIQRPAKFVTPSALVFGEMEEPMIAVTPRTPLPVRDDTSSLSLIERLNREGEPLSSFSQSTFTSFAAPTGAGTPGPSPYGSPVGVGRAIFIQHVSFWSTTPIAGRFQHGGANWSTGIGSFSGQNDIGFACGPGYSASFPVNGFVRSSDKAGIGSYVKQWFDAGVSGTHFVGCGASGFQLADSINFDAKKVILFIGDSLWNGTGPSDVTKCIPWLVNRFYRDERGIDCRYILKAYSGSTSGGHETFRQGGRYEFEQVDAIFYQLGTNDVGQGYSTATSMANVQALIAWKQKRYPHAKLVIVGPPPVQTNAHETALTALRAAEQAYVTGLGDPHVLFCNLGGSFDRTINANYVASDSSGAAVHPGDAGLVLEWNGGHAGNPGLKAWLEANLSAI